MDNYKEYRTVVYLTHQQRAGLEQLVRESGASLPPLGLFPHSVHALDKQARRRDGRRNERDSTITGATHDPRMLFLSFLMER